MERIESKILAELEKEFPELLERSARGESFQVPHQSGTAVLMDQSEVDELLERIDVLEALLEGVRDYLEGRVFTVEESRKALDRDLEEFNESKGKHS